MGVWDFVRNLKSKKKKDGLVEITDTLSVKSEEESDLLERVFDEVKKRIPPDRLSIVPMNSSREDDLYGRRYEALHRKICLDDGNVEEKILHSIQSEIELDLKMSDGVLVYRPYKLIHRSYVGDLGDYKPKGHYRLVYAKRIH